MRPFLFTHVARILFVFDLIIIGNSKKLIDYFVTKQSNRFSLKDLGNLTFFLGVEVVRTGSGLLLSQQQYIRQLLDKFNMTTSKPMLTPMSQLAQLKLDDGTDYANSKEYRQLVGSLRYLNMTLSYISYIVNKLSQFMHNPTESHLSHLKRIRHYLKRTIQHAFVIKIALDYRIIAFGDADWGGNLNDRTSTTGYIAYFWWHSCLLEI